MSNEDKTNIIIPSQFKALVTEEAGKRSAVFVVLAGTQVGKMYKIDKREMVIGRSLEASLRIDDDGISRMHAKVICSDDAVVEIKDLNSTNGTFCNGQTVASQVLRDGDKVQVGSTTILKFSYQDSLDEEFQRQQYESATRDALTGAYNKKFFLDRIPSEFTYAQRHEKPLSLGMLDIDFFKKVNDTYGHQAGDYVLKVVTQIIQDVIRGDDILARYGGEEFALIMRDTPPELAFIAVERVRRRIEEEIIIYSGQKIAVTISAGIGAVPGEGIRTVDDLIKQADEYLYSAKHKGRNRTESGVL